VGKLTPEGLKKLWQSKSMLKSIMDAADARLKAMPDEQLAALGLAKKTGSERRSCTDPQKALSLLKKYVATNGGRIVRVVTTTKTTLVK
jgi:hypothetical protein